MNKKYIKLIIALCGLSASSIGVFNNSVGVFTAPVSQDLGILRGSFAFYVTIFMYSLGVANLFVAKIINDKNVKLITILGMTVSALTAVFMAFCNTTWQFYVLGAIRGISVSCYQTIIITNVIHGWFKKHQGLINSIVISIAGVAGVILPQVFTWAINNMGWRNGFLLMGAIAFALSLPIFFTPFTLHPEAIGEKPYGEEETNTSKASNDKPFKFTSVSFIIIIIFAIFTSTGHGLVSSLSAYGESIGMAQVGVNAMSAAMAANIVSKLIAGSLYDKFNALVANAVSLTISLIGLIGLMLSTNGTVIVVCSFLFGFMYATISIGFNFIARDFFGLNNFNKTLPIISLFALFGNATSVSAFSSLYDITNTYKYMFILMAIFTVCNLCLLFIANKKSRSI